MWTDLAVLQMDQARLDTAAELMRRAVKRLPAHALSWIMLLHAEMEQWRTARLHVVYPPGTLAARLGGKAAEPPERAAGRFYDTLAQARKFHPQAEFIFQFEGSAALIENDLPRALKAFEHACTLDPEDARNYVSLAECRFAQREYAAAGSRPGRRCSGTRGWSQRIPGWRAAWWMKTQAKRGITPRWR